MEKNLFKESRLLNMLQPKNECFLLGENKFNYVEDDCLDIWIDLSDSIQRDINNEEKIKYVDRNFVLTINDDRLEVTEGYDNFIYLVLLLKALLMEVKSYNLENINDELNDVENCFKLNGKLRFISNDKDLINILETGIVSDEDNSNYASCYRFYKNIIQSHVRVNKMLNVLMLLELLYQFEVKVKLV